MRGPDNGLTKPLLIKTLAMEVAKMFNAMPPGSTQYVSEHAYLPDMRGCTISSSVPNRSNKPGVIVVLTPGVNRPVNLCVTLLSAKRAELFWNLAKRFHKKAMEFARAERLRVQKVYTTTSRFIVDNENLMIFFK